MAFEPARRDIWLQGVFLEIDDETGKARRIDRIQERLEER
jgi:hypothetical protein